MPSVPGFDLCLCHHTEAVETRGGGTGQSKGSICVMKFVNVPCL